VPGDLILVAGHRLTHDLSALGVLHSRHQTTNLLGGLVVGDAQLLGDLLDFLVRLHLERVLPGQGVGQRQLVLHRGDLIVDRLLAAAALLARLQERIGRVGVVAVRRPGADAVAC
jgi:hypothetical protein